MRKLTQKKIQTQQVFGLVVSEFLHTVKNNFNLRYFIAAVLLLASPFLMYLFKIVPDTKEWYVLGMNINIGDYYDAKTFVWTLSQKVIPVIAITGIFFLFPAVKSERFISIYWLVFPLFSIYLYQTIWVFIDTSHTDLYFMEFTVWAVIISSIFSLALFRQFLIQKERAFDRKLESIQEVIQQLRDEEIFKLFSTLYNIDVATGKINSKEEAAVWRAKINDYALDGMKNINTILELLDDQKEEINKIDNQTVSHANLAF